MSIRFYLPKFPAPTGVTKRNHSRCTLASDSSKVFGIKFQVVIIILAIRSDQSQGKLHLDTPDETKLMSSTYICKVFKFS